MKIYKCPCCHQYTSENYLNEKGKIVCQQVVNRSGKLVMCGFEFYINEYNGKDNSNGKEK